jgi:hypothetical protein
MKARNSFLWSEKHPNMLDLSVEILRSEEGNMRRRWLGVLLRVVEFDRGKC